MIEIGQTYNEYHVEALIGQGGMGKVFVVSKGGENFALKELVSTDETEIKRFKREVRLMKTIQTGLAVPVLYDDLDGPIPFYIMPLYNGSLEDLIINHHYNDEEKLDIAIKVCEAINSVHASGIMHRDIKPQNFLCKDERIYISDFGLGRVVDRDSTTLTSTTKSLGTRGYAAPELYDAGNFKNYDVRTDVYALGKTLYFIFSGDTNVTDVDEGRIPPQYVILIRKCTEHNKGYRYHSVNEIVNILKTIQETNTGVSISDLHQRIETDANLDDTTTKDIVAVLNDENIDATGKMAFLRKMSRNQRYLLVDDDNNRMIIMNLLSHIGEDAYALEFSDVEIIVGLLLHCFDKCDNLVDKQKTLQDAIQYAIGYNRFETMRMIIKLLNSFDEKSLTTFVSFFITEKENIRGLYTTIGETIPNGIRRVLS